MTPLNLDAIDEQFGVEKFYIDAGIMGSGLHRAYHGELEAEILVNGERYKVSRRYGSWSLLHDGERHLDQRIAAVLQDKARPLDNELRAQREKEKKAK